MSICAVDRVRAFDRVRRVPAVVDRDLRRPQDQRATATADPVFSVLRCAAVGAFALANGGPASSTGDLPMLAAVVVCGLGGSA
jgi:hypothetical protein